LVRMLWWAWRCTPNCLRSDAMEQIRGIVSHTD
jgi:hypothetical protein